VEYQNQERCQLTQSHALKVNTYLDRSGCLSQSLNILDHWHTWLKYVQHGLTWRRCKDHVQDRGNPSNNSDLILNNQYGHHHVDHN